MHVTIVIIYGPRNTIRVKKKNSLLLAFIKNYTKLFLADCHSFVNLQWSPNLAYCFVSLCDTTFAIIRTFQIKKIPIRYTLKHTWHTFLRTVSGNIPVPQSRHYLRSWSATVSKYGKRYVTNKKTKRHTNFISNYCTKLSSCASTCFGHILWPSSGNHNIIKTEATYHMSVNGKHVYISIIKQSVDVQYY